MGLSTPTNAQVDTQIVALLNKGASTFKEICVAMGIPRDGVNQSGHATEKRWRQVDRRLQALKRLSHVYFDQQNRVWRLCA